MDHALLNERFVWRDMIPALVLTPKPRLSYSKLSRGLGVDGR